MTHHLVIKNISQLLTLNPLTQTPHKADVTEEDLGTINNAWISIRNGLVENYGTNKNFDTNLVSENTEVFDAKNGIILPGLVDSHTHILYGGSRSDEFAKRLGGMSYQEIAQAGGGIYSTIKATTESSDEELILKSQERLDHFLSYGVTTLEAKSGYSLDLKEELRQLRLLKQIKESCKQELKITSLPLHAVPKDKTSKYYIGELVHELLPVIKEQNLADFVDMFIEEGYFKTSECEPFIKKIKELGLGLKIHADEFTHSGGTRLAAQWKAASADHLQFSSQEDKKLLAQNHVVATLLPGTSLYTKIPFTQAQDFIREGCSVALASDHNPGSCQLSNLPMLASVAALHCGLTPPQTLAAITFMGARAIYCEKTKGSLAKGIHGDCILLPFDHYHKWLANFGEKKPQQVWIKGQKVYSA